MALTTIDQILVKQKSLNSIRNAGGAAVLALKAWWMGRNQEGKNGKLYFAQFSTLTGYTNICDAACKVHFIYLKKGTSGTDCFYKVFDNTANDATAADADFGLLMSGASDEQTWWSKDGLDLAAGYTHGTYTTFLGYNATTAGVAVDGFVILGDA